MRTNKKPRSDSYEAQLSSEEREQLHGWLLDPSLSSAEVQKQTIPWRKGKQKGKQPDLRTLSAIGQRLRLERSLSQVEARAIATMTKVAAILKRYKGRKNVYEQMTDEVMTLITDEVLGKTLDQLDPAQRTSAARLLLKRSDQRLAREKFNLTLRKYKESAKARQKEETKEGATNPPNRAVPRAVLDQVVKELNLL